MQRIGLLSEAVPVITSAIDFFSQFGGDKVPNYPIKSLNTLNAIESQISALLPMPPTSLDNAKSLLVKAQQLWTEAVAKDNAGPRGGDPSLTTYIMKYQEIITALQNYITAGGGSVVTPTGGYIPPGTVVNKPNNFLLLGLGAVVLYFVFKKRR